MDPAKLKVVELRAELSKRGLDSKGNKPVLVERLRQALEEEKTEPKTHIEPTEKIEQLDSEDEGSNSESKSPEHAKLPPRTPSRSSRHASREPTTPARTPTRRSSSRSSLSRQSPAKTMIGENLNETTSVLEPIVEEEKSSPKKDEIDSTPEEIDSQTPIEEDVPPKQDTTPAITSETETDLLTPATDSDQVTPKKDTPTTPVTDVTTSPKTENILINETLKVQKDEQLDIVKEAEKHVPDNSEEITRRSVDDFCKIDVQTSENVNETVTQSPDELQTQSPVKLIDQSPTKLGSQSPTKISIQSPIKPSTESSDNYTNESPVKSSPTKIITESPVKSIQNLSTMYTAQSPVKNDNLSPVKSITQSPTKYGSPQKGEQSPLKEMESSFKKSDTDESIQIDKGDTKDESSKDKDSDDLNDESMNQMNDIQMETDEQDEKNEKSNDKSEDRKRKRSPSPREDAPRAPPIARPENEPTFDDKALLLSWYDSDMNLVIDTSQYFSASPMQGDGFNYMWAGVRASHGFTKGKIFYEARVNTRFDTPAPPPAPNSANTSGALPVDDEKIPSVLRLGWSTLGTSLQLGEEKLSYGYDSTGKKSVNKEFVEYGKTFALDDVIGCYADFETDGNVTLTYTVNGESQGPAFILKKEDLNNKALFPHVLSKNCSFTVNLGQEDNWSNEILDGYISVGKVDLSDRIAGPRRPEKREDCEVILLVGLPFSGKTSWVKNHVAENPDKYYSVLGTHNLIEKMTIDGAPLKDSYKGRWENVVEKCSRALTKLLDSAPSRRRNYILDQQANVYGSTQKRKARNFYGFHRKGVVLVPTDEEFKARIAKRKEEPDGEEIRESSILEVKANFSAPIVGESFEEVIWGELNEEEGKKLIETYNTEGKKSGYGQNLQQPNKRSRFDNGQKDRNNRDNRGHRRSGYNDRRPSSSPWRGGGSSGASSGSSSMGGGRRDGAWMRGTPMRHSSSYGGSNWRGRGGVLTPSRSGGSDRRQGNDRNRSSGTHRSSWNPMGYQGSQHGGSSGVWSNQSNWSGQSQAAWGSQASQSSWGSQQTSAWGGSGSNWKSYAQNSYGQSTGYGQQTGSGYGNGNWNWNHQYYNQYWPSGQQQHQSGGQTQTTAGSGGGGSQSSSKK